LFQDDDDFWERQNRFCERKHPVKNHLILIPDKMSSFPTIDIGYAGLLSCTME
jgi:hypothetical protein